MRFLVAEPGPHFSVQDVHNGWCEALRRAGQHVSEFNLGDRLTFFGSALKEVAEGQFARYLTASEAIELAVDGLYASLMKNRPHVLLVISAFFTPPQLIHLARDAGVKVVIAHTESPYEDERQLILAHHANLNLVNDRVSLDKFREISRAEYFGHAFRPSIHYPGHPRPGMACDFAFVGTGFPSRVDFFEAMDLAGINVALAGNWNLLDDDSPLLPAVIHERDDCFDNDDAADLYRAAKVGLNLYRREAREKDTAQGWSMGPREVEMAACGLFFLRDPRGEGDEVLDMLPTFTSPQDASEQLRWWLAHDSDREAAARKAREAIQDRTFDVHAARLLRLLEGE